MRNVRVGAIQPRLVAMPEIYSYLSDSYKNDPKEIIQGYFRRQLVVTTDLLAKAGETGCDIVTTCEDVGGISNYSIDVSAKNVFPELVALSQPILDDALSTLARKYSMYIVGCFLKHRNGTVFNTASIYDRSGKVVGEYIKTHLPANEKWQMTPGDKLEPFTLDFGTIGISICYDMMFPEVVRVLALKGAEVIFHPTYGYSWYDSIGEATIRTRANDNGVYIVTSKNFEYNAAGKSSIVDYWGQVLADAGFNENQVLVKEIDLDHKKVQPDWYFNTRITGINEVSVRLARERRPELYQNLVVPNPEQLSLPDHDHKLEIFQEIKSGTCHW